MLSTSHIIGIIAITAILSAQIAHGQYDPNSHVYEYPANDTAQFAIAITEVVDTQYVDLTINSSDSLNLAGKRLWYWYYFESSVGPYIDVHCAEGIDSVVVYGPLGTHYMDAVDSIYANLAPIEWAESKSAPSFDSYHVPYTLVPGNYFLAIYPHELKTRIIFGEILRWNPGIRSPVDMEGRRPCQDCLFDGTLTPGKYTLSLWSSVESAPSGTTSFTSPQATVTITYPLASPGVYSALPVGHVIDGWQQMEGEFEVGPGATFFELLLGCSSGNCLFDDIRFHPSNASMKSYVYDPLSLRLLAELDERNYATIYEYDEEGRLKRVKKETERGIMTIQETTTHNSRYDPLEP